MPLEQTLKRMGRASRGCARVRIRCMKATLSTSEISTVPSLPAESWKTRRVLPEALDALKADDPRAQRSRHELDIFNFLMGNHAWIRRQVSGLYRPHHRLLEVGAGSGVLAKKLADHGAWRESDIIGMDVTPRPEAWPQHAVWRQGDVLQHSVPDAEVVVANLLLHQFTKAQLRAFAQSLPPSCTTLIAVEPLRSRAVLMLGRTIARIVRASAVTVHDMILSLHAGFRGDELPAALGLKGWSAQVSHTLRGAYRLVMSKGNSPSRQE
jgi:hypothetical protein